MYRARHTELSDGTCFRCNPRHRMKSLFVLLSSRPLVCAVMAAASIANIVKSSLGPVGLDKMLVDDIGVSVTS